MDSVIRTAKKSRNRGWRLTREGSLIINMVGGVRDYVEIVPARTHEGGALVFYDVTQGRGEGERRYLMTLTVRGAINLHRYLPVLINNARRLSS